MNARLSRLFAILLLAGIAVAGVAVIAVVHFAADQAPPAQKDVAAIEPSAADFPPSLDCAFHDMMRTHAVVSFYFDVDVIKDQTPRFFERAIVARDGTRTNFEGDARPVWTYGLDDDGKPMIKSSDGATRIVLYNLKLGASGILPVEAGIRSNVYRNLGGECRQTNLHSRDAAEFVTGPR